MLFYFLEFHKKCEKFSFLKFFIKLPRKLKKKTSEIQSKIYQQYFLWIYGYNFKLGAAEPLKSYNKMWWWNTDAPGGNKSPKKLFLEKRSR